MLEQPTRDKLRALDVAQNTVLWFTSDNGGREPEANNGQLRDDKGSLWEGGLRVPAIIEWPGHIDHRITNVPASTSDIYPTVLELAGVERKYPDRPLDGVSLLPLIEGEMSQRPGMGFWEYPSGGRLAYSDRFLKTLHRTRNEGKEAKVRLPLKHTADKNYPGVKKRQGHAAWIDGDWKLHRLNNGNKYELYHLAEDPNEQNNVIDNHPDRTRHMKKALRRWQKSVSDSLHGRDY